MTSVRYRYRIKFYADFISRLDEYARQYFGVSYVRYSVIYVDLISVDHVSNTD